MKYSIIIPVYNRENTITICVEGILNTKYKDFEVILVDDGSRDNSLRICNELANKYPNVKCYTQKNGGVSSARNRGIKEANGRWIMFADSDDTFFPNSLFDIEQIIDEKNDIIVFKHGKCKYTKSGLKFNKNNDLSLIERIEGNDNIIKWLFTDYDPYHNPIYSICGKIFRSEIIKNNNIKFKENVSLGEDQIFVCDYLQYVTSFLYIDKAYYQLIIWPKELRSWGLGSIFRTPEDFLHNQKENYLALNKLYCHCNLLCVKEFLVNYILDRPITRIIFRHSILLNKKRVTYKELNDFVTKKLKPLLALEYSNKLMLHDRNVAKYVTMIMEEPFWKVMMYSYIEQNMNYMINIMRLVVSKIKRLIFN